jgi:glucose-6-phosphate 1-dehydrogenase
MPASIPALTVVIAGASGDLTQRLLFPAIHRLVADNLLPSSTRIVGYAMDDWTTDQFAAHLRQGIERYGDGVDERAWADLSSAMAYVSGDLSESSTARLAPLVQGPTVFYLALPPSLFGPAATALAGAGLADESNGWRRLVVEKPFGTDVASARALQAQLLSGWREEQVFRIDHFLGKDTVQNVLLFRLANRFVEAIWNQANISQVQITAAETLGLEGRWRYYDHAGALRDMLQNHLMQLFAITAMEPPTTFEGETVRQHKVDVLRATRGPDRNDIETRAVRGRYQAGPIGGQPVPGYLEEPNIAATSTTETYAALRLEVDNWRWQGVPFYLRSGKRLGGDLTEIALQLKDPPRLRFDHGGIDPGSAVSDDGNDDDGYGHQWIVLRLRPDETIEIDAIAKKAGFELEIERITLTATDPKVAKAEYSAYEQLLIDLVNDDRSPFVRGDEALEAWRICQPVLDAWAASGDPIDYDAGTDGPEPPPGLFPPGLPRWRPVAP